MTASDCPRCNFAMEFDRPAYALLLGYYLGDGCISALAKGVYMLRVSCDAKYPGIVADAEQAMLRVRPTRRTYRVRASGCVVVQSMWKHWVCLYPQHGAGPKHLRPIVLADWQQAIVQQHPEPLLRGLFLSDGCRIGVHWTRPRTRDLSVARRADVARLDEFIGPKS